MLEFGAFKRIKGFKKILKAFIIGVYVNYHYCEMKPAEIIFAAGGADLGLTFGTEFWAHYGSIKTMPGLMNSPGKKYNLLKQLKA